MNKPVPPKLCANLPADGHAVGRVRHAAIRLTGYGLILFLGCALA